jgi:ABC-type sulfate transport system permease component
VNSVQWIRILMRVLGGLLGALAGPIAIFLSFLFLVSEHQEMEAMHGSWSGLFVAALIALGFAAFGVLVSYYLLRYALRGNKTD